MALAQTDIRPYQPSRNLRSKIARRLTQWQCARPLAADPAEAMVSFTFDDFPCTAARNGAEVLERFDARGCFYAATGLAGGTSPGGPLFTEDDIIQLVRSGHEIGGHTVSHEDLARMPQDRALREIRENLDQLRAMGAGDIRQFAYPYGETTPALKRALTDTFIAARGILPGLNRAGSDAMQLRSVEIDASEQSLARGEAMIEAALRQKAWLIFFTHDVTPRPGGWGTTPEALTRLVRRARDGGARIVTPSEAMDRIGAQAA